MVGCCSYKTLRSLLKFAASRTVACKRVVVEVKVLEFTADKVITCSISVTLPSNSLCWSFKDANLCRDWRMWRNWAVGK